ncbi:MAG: DNA-binding protein [Candidatus Neomarinimicrobiota bacterium]|nr:MAG: DNA-binding protein [Candidatus Neomarinimicrobiota bacterium]
MSSIEQEILSLEEAGRLLRLRKRTMYRLLKNGAIPGVKIGGQWRIRREDILRLFVRNQKSHPGG